MKSILILVFLFVCGFSFAQTNLLDTSTWTVGNGSVTGFSRLGSDVENVRELGTTPHGGTEVLWKAVPDSNNDGDGGWNSPNIPADHTKTYRYTLWLKKTNSNDGYTYFGPYAYDSSNNSNSLSLNGTLTTNPYFFSGDLPQLNTWYLLVGYLHESGYTGTESQGGIYDASGTKVGNLTDYKFSSNSTQLRHRAYLFYDTNINDRQFFWEPTLYEVNGQEPTISELLNPSGGTDIQAPTAPTLSSTAQTDTTVDLSWTGATDDTAVIGYKIFKDGVLEATLGNVNTYQVTGLSASANYNFTATALDAAGNESGASNAVSITTNSSGGGAGGDTVWNTSGSDIDFTAGNVGIGTAAQASYRLAVDGKIHAKEVKVDLNGWADYVFTKDYDLPTLEEVKKHIDEKGHLMNIPSAVEVEANGIQLGEMNKLLLEKIEELTLYILKQENRISKLEDLQKNNKK